MHLKVYFQKSIFQRLHLSLVLSAFNCQPPASARQILLSLAINFKISFYLFDLEAILVKSLNIMNCICQNISTCDTFTRHSQTYFSKLQNVFVQIAKCIYPNSTSRRVILKADLHGSHPEDCDLYFCFFIFSFPPDAQMIPV